MTTPTGNRIRRSPRDPPLLSPIKTLGFPDPQFDLMDAAAAAAAPPPAAAAVPRSPASQSAGMSNCYVFKCRLQEYAQKAGFCTPEYHTLKEGPSHDPIFRSTVTVNNVKYDSLPGFFSRKVAEQSAAEVALIEIYKSGQMTESIPTVHETGLCKNMLQEYSQKMNYAIPAYICTKKPVGPSPFICTVDIGGIRYIGAAAKTKKEAEIKAARTALLAIEHSSEIASNGASQYTVLPVKKKATETPPKAKKPLQPKKDGFKKKFAKRKFPRKNGQSVDASTVPSIGTDVNTGDQHLEGQNSNQEREPRKVEGEHGIPLQDSNTLVTETNGCSHDAQQREPALWYPDRGDNGADGTTTSAV